MAVTITATTADPCPCCGSGCYPDYTTLYVELVLGGSTYYGTIIGTLASGYFEETPTGSTGPGYTGYDCQLELIDVTGWEMRITFPGVGLGDPVEITDPCDPRGLYTSSVYGWSVTVSDAPLP